MTTDKSLTPEQLDDKYNPEGDGEHPHYTRRDWREEVENYHTISGYWFWVAAQIEQAYDEEKQNDN
jgi:hypothetical protein